MRTSAVALLVLFVLAVCGLATTGAAANRGQQLRPLLQTTLTGEITALDPRRIAIGRFACMVPARDSASVGRFVIGDPVRIACRSGQLRSATYSPETETGATDAPAAPGTKPNVPPPPRPSASQPFTSFTVTFGSITLGQAGSPAGGSTTPAAPSLTTESGPIAVLDSTSINVGGVTCLLGTSDFDTGFVYQALLRLNLAEGDQATVTCADGVLSKLSSSS
jgi:hypothetical protein